MSCYVSNSYELRHEDGEVHFVETFFFLKKESKQEKMQGIHLCFNATSASAWAPVVGMGGE